MLHTEPADGGVGRKKETWGRNQQKDKERESSTQSKRRG